VTAAGMGLFLYTQCAVASSSAATTDTVPAPREVSPCSRATSRRVVMRV
jgi:hypothetical protein